MLLLLLLPLACHLGDIPVDAQVYDLSEGCWRAEPVWLKARYWSAYGEDSTVHCEAEVYWVAATTDGRCIAFDRLCNRFAWTDPFISLDAADCQACEEAEVRIDQERCP